MRKYELPNKVRCPKCSVETNEVSVTKSGPHLKAMCQHCGAYIKFLKATAAEPKRKKHEEKQGCDTPFYIVSATRGEGLGSLTIIDTLTESSQIAQAQKTRIEKAGYKASVDYIPTDETVRREIDRMGIKGGRYEKRRV